MFGGIFFSVSALLCSAETRKCAFSPYFAPKGGEAVVIYSRKAAIYVYYTPYFGKAQ
jgi:hypothetical protein